MNKVKFLVMDVDGTLTDGKIYMGSQGELIKAFDIKDGAGIVFELPGMGITPVIITARESSILEIRCSELHISELHQGSKDKLKTLLAILKKYNADLSSVAYAGDDLTDIPCMEEVRKAGGAVICPADAIPEVKALAEYVSGYNAGDGAIRDCIHYLAQRRSVVTEERIRKAVRWILSGEYRDGFLPDGSPYSIQEYITKKEDDCILESHRKHIDIQDVLEGHEELKIYATHCLTSTGIYDSEKDAEYWKNGAVVSHNVLVPGSLIIIHNNQPHKGAIIHKETEKVRKLVCKIEV